MNKWVIRLVIWTFCFVFLIELGYFGISIFRSIKLQMYGVRTTGTVIDLIPERSCAGTKNCIPRYNYRHLVQFTPKGSNKNVAITDPSFIFDTRNLLSQEELHSRYGYLIGTSVGVIYDPTNVTNATVASAIWQDSFLGTVLLIVTIVTGLIVWFSYRNNAKKTITANKKKSKK